MTEHDEETDETPVLPDSVPAGDTPPVTSSEQSASDQPIESVSERGYLTLSQLSPRKPIAAESPEPMLDSQDDREAPAPALDQPPPVIVSADRPPSPMPGTTASTALHPHPVGGHPAVIIRLAALRSLLHMQGLPEVVTGYSTQAPALQHTEALQQMDQARLWFAPSIPSTLHRT